MMEQERIKYRDRNVPIDEVVTLTGLKTVLEEVLKQTANVINFCREQNYPEDYIERWERRFNAVNSAIAEFQEPDRIVVKSRLEST